MKIGLELFQHTSGEQALQGELYALAQYLMPRYGYNWPIHSLVTLRLQALKRLLYYNTLYEKIIDVPGVICEFGVHWGATLAQLINLRGIYEPFNHSRRIVGFDTFEGFTSVDPKDGELAKLGDYASEDGYEQVLDRILGIHESFSPVANIKKYELVKGDASGTIDGWLRDNPHALVAMAIFDMDVYKPTKDALEKIIPRLTKGSLLVFDELNCPQFPGETRALDEVLGLNNIMLRRSPLQPYCSWAVFGEVSGR